MSKARVEFMYRCGGNYKTVFTRDLDKSIADKLEVGETIQMGYFETPTAANFFNSEIHPHPFNTKYDHDLLEVVNILPLPVSG